MNTVSITGRLAQDPRMVEDAGTTHTHFTVAVRAGVDDGGQEREPNWTPVVVFGRQAETVYRHKSKGHLVAVEGQIVSGRAITEAGETVTYVNVLARRVEFLARPRAARAMRLTSRPSRRPPTDVRPGVGRRWGGRLLSSATRTAVLRPLDGSDDVDSGGCEEAQHSDRGGTR